jgi:hypothetical protein
MKRNVAAILLTSIAILGVGRLVVTHKTAHAAAVMAPRFEVDPFWPKPSPRMRRTTSGSSTGPGLSKPGKRTAQPILPPRSAAPPRLRYSNSMRRAT